MDRFEFDALKLTETSSWITRIGRFNLILTLFFVLILFLPWRQSVEGEGKLIAYDPAERTQPISAPISGFIEKFYIQENQKVLKKQKLFEMIDPDKEYKSRVYKMKEDFHQQEQNIQNEKKILQEQKSGLHSQKKIGLELYDKRFIQAKEQLKTLQLKLQAQQKNHEVTLNAFKRIEKLYLQKIESKQHYEKAENSYINAKTQLDKTSIDITVQERHLSILQEEKKHFTEEINNKIRSLENSILSVQTRLSILKRDYERHLMEIARYETSTAVAQKDGVVMRILQNSKNTYIAKGSSIVQFAPNVTQRSLLFKVSDFNMPLIKEGLLVRIRFHGWPVLHIPGWPAIRFGTFGGLLPKLTL